METKVAAYENTSTSLCHVQFTDYQGQEWRIEKLPGQKGFKFYRKEDGGFWFDGWCGSSRRGLPKTPATIRNTLNEYLGCA